MPDLVLLLFGFICGLGWGVMLSEEITKRRNKKRIESRIIIDAPFSNVQAEIILRTLADLADSAGRAPVK